MKQTVLFVTLITFVFACAVNHSPTRAEEESIAPVVETLMSIEEWIQKDLEPKRRASLEKVLEAKNKLDQSLFSKAKELLVRAQSLDPQNPFVYFYQGKLMQLQEKWSQSEQSYTRAAFLFEQENEMAWQKECMCLAKIVNHQGDPNACRP